VWGLLLVVLVAVAAAPYVLSSNALKNWTMRRVFADVRGTVTVGRLSLDWFSPPSLEDLEIRSPDGEPVIMVESFAAEQPLWSLVAHGTQIGRIRVEQPHANLVIKPTGNNFAQTFPRRAEKRPARWRQVAVQVLVDDAKFSWQLIHSSDSWSVDHIKLSAGIEPEWLSPSGQAQIVINPGTLLDNTELSPGMCNDVLKYIAPVFANVATARGQISIVLGDGRLPAGKPRDGKLSGALVLHSVDVSPNNMVRKLADFFDMAGSIHLARESTVKFEMDAGRVHHQGLEFGVEGVRVRSSGWVGLDDQSLDLLAEVQFEFSDAEVAKGPLARSLNHKVVRLPIHGTLNQPQLDWSDMGAAGRDLLATTLQKLGRNETDGNAEAVDQLQKQGVLSGSAGSAAPEVNLPAAASELLKQIMERRRQRQEQSRLEQQPPSPPQGSLTPAPPDGTETPRRGRLSRALDRLLDGQNSPAVPTPREPQSSPPDSSPAPTSPPPGSKP
jgi:hypothetical protein